MKRDYSDPFYAGWRKKIFSRDKHKCQMPGCGYKKALNAHHIVRWSDSAHLRFDENNGITLCWKCHKEITGAEAQYAPLFMDIVRENNGRNSGSNSNKK